jgi:succinate-semialdehyde dehydrogenase / glutarate-semialdehyde dehydrogenase
MSITELPPLNSINPATLEYVKEYQQHSEQDIEKRLTRLNVAQKEWSATKFTQRKACMQKLVAELERIKEHAAHTMALEMGKPWAQGIREISKCAWLSSWFADSAEAYLDAEIIPTEFQRSYVQYEPIGNVLAIMPWNFPFWQVFRCAVPAIMAGNGVVLKHAPSTQGCAEIIEQLFLEAGFPEGLLVHIKVDNSRVKALIAHPAVNMITFTGSTEAGRVVAKQAAEYLKPSVLELGGSDPYLVFDDAVVKNAAEKCAQSRWLNTGQSCIAAKRIIVLDAVFDEFMTQFLTFARQYRFTNPSNRSTEGFFVGPMARIDLRDQLAKQVVDSIDLGAHCALGGQIPEAKGAYYPVTVLSNVSPGMPAFDQELFGPVAAIIRAKDDQQAIALANTTTYGLGAAIFTESESRIAQYPILLHSGNIAINDMVKSDPRLPFGGYNDSGWGKELGLQGIRTFTRTQTVVQP